MKLRFNPITTILAFQFTYNFTNFIIRHFFTSHDMKDSHNKIFFRFPQEKENQAISRIKFQDEEKNKQISMSENAIKSDKKEGEF